MSKGDSLFIQVGHIIRVCAQKSFSRGRRQPTPRPSPSQEGRNGNERGGSRKNYPSIFLP
ncbi:MAG: hypothetical protein F6K48_02350 [Okeania sp. SIO3H1]|nr:hypothetical protein [Okeania sp. SIO3H1]